MSKKQYGILTPILFDINDNEWIKYLETEGYVVIQNIIDNTQNEELIEIFKKEWNKVSPNFNWNNKKTWTLDNSPMIWSKGSAVYNGFGHSEFMWKLRINKNVQEPFKKIFKTQDIVTSFDGFNVFLSNTQQSTKWLHQDQRSNDNRLSIQGAINLKPVDKNDAGFVVVPKSHITHVPPPSNNDWILLDKKDVHYKKAVKLLIPANCLVLWNSKTIHANTGMTNKLKNMHLNRLTAYITFCPKSRRSQEMFNKRIGGYLKAESTSHWADRHEIKKLPFHVKKKYSDSNFNNITPNMDIPNEYMELI